MRQDAGGSRDARAQVGDQDRGVLRKVPERKRHQDPGNRVFRPPGQDKDRHQGDPRRQSEMHPLEIEPAHQAMREGGGLTVDVHLDHLGDVLDLVAGLHDDGRLQDEHHPRAASRHLNL